MFSVALEMVLSVAFREALSRRHAHLTLEHLLYALAHALFQSKVTIHSAHVATYGERAVDTFYVTDLTGDKITAHLRLKSIERRLLDAAVGDVDFARAA